MKRKLVAYFLMMFVASGGAASLNPLTVTIGGDDDGNELEVTLRPSDLKIPQYQDIRICSAIPIPEDARYLVGITPTAVIKTPYDLRIILCDELPSQAMDETTGASGVTWECTDSQYRDQSSLMDSSQCQTKVQSFSYEYRSLGGQDEGSFFLPHGTGFPVGDGTSIQSIVAVYHFADSASMVNQSMAGFGVELDFLRNKHHIQPVNDLQIVCRGLACLSHPKSCPYV